MHEQLGLLVFLVLAVICGIIQICIGNTTPRLGLRWSLAAPRGVRESAQQSRRWSGNLPPEHPREELAQRQREVHV